MSGERQSRTWWGRTVARFERSGLGAAAFAEAEGVNAGTLRWWAWRLRREGGSGAVEKGSKKASRPVRSEAVVPLRVEVASGQPAWRAGRVEVVVGTELVVRFEGEVDVGFVAELVGRLRAAAC